MKRTKKKPESLLRQVFETFGAGLTPKLAKSILAIKFSKEETERATELADKCNEGLLTPEERAEYTRIVNLGTELAILKSRARLFLSADKS
jgi:hypothetical protein